MKKKVVLAIAAVLTAMIIVGAIAVWTNTQKVGQFDLDFYAEEIAQFPSDKVLGPVTSTTDAKEKAEAVWVETYGEYVKKEKPYGVSYDKDTGTWLVLGHLPKGAIGGVAHILIRESDGAVLAIWHDK